MSAAEAALVWCPFPDEDTARKVAGQLLEAKVIACANILPAMTSVFEWKGEICSATECAVVLKTSAHLLDTLIKRLGEIHPYDTPAIVGWRCDAAHPSTKTWLGEVLPSQGT